MPLKLSTGWGDEKAVIQSFLNRQMLNRFFLPPKKTSGAPNGVALPMEWRSQFSGATNSAELPAAPRDIASNLFVSEYRCWRCPQSYRCALAHCLAYPPIPIQPIN